MSAAQDIPRLPRLVLHTQGVDFVGGVNDVPFLRDEKGVGLATTANLGQWLSDHGNRLTARVRPLAKAAAYPAVVELTIGFPDTGEAPLAVLNWHCDPGQTFAAFQIDLPFSLAVPAPTELFHAAHDFSQANESARAEAGEAAKALGRRLHQAFAAKDAAAAARLLEYRSVEKSRALGDALDDVRRLLPGEMEKLLAREGTLEPIDERSYRAELVGGGRLFLLTRDGEDLVTIRHAKGAIRMPIYVAKIGEEWRVVR